MPNSGPFTTKPETDPAANDDRLHPTESSLKVSFHHFAVYCAEERTIKP
jgi:hypothetical protein